MLNRLRHTWIAPALAAVMLMALVACGGQVTKADDASGQPVSVLVAAAVSAQATSPPDVASIGPVAEPVASPLDVNSIGSVAEPAAAATLDADAIVAAHEEVLADVYQSVLPSVVRI